MQYLTIHTLDWNSLKRSRETLRDPASPRATTSIKRSSARVRRKFEIDNSVITRNAAKLFSAQPPDTGIWRKSIDSTEKALCGGSSRGTCLEFTISRRSAQSNSISCGEIETTWISFNWLFALGWSSIFVLPYLYPRVRVLDFANFATWQCTHNALFLARSFRDRV